MAKSDTGFKLVDGWLCLTNSYEVFFLFFSGHVFGKKTYHPSCTQILNGIELFYG